MIGMVIPDVRWDDFRRRFPADWPYRAVSHFPATDGKLCPPPAWWTESAGAWGCLRSHHRIIEECLNSGIESVLIDPGSGLRADAGCAGALELPFALGSAPVERAPCAPAPSVAAGEVKQPAKSWLQRLFGK